MGIEEFLTSVLLPNIFLYLSLLLGLSVIYFLIFRNYITSILDPLFLAALFSLLGCTVVFLLFFTGNIKEKYFFNYLFTQASFFLGFIVFGRLKLKLSDGLFLLKDEAYVLQCVFLISAIMYIGITIFSYSVMGIPILQASRLDINANAKSGLGILSRFTDVSGLICQYCIINYLFKKKKSWLMVVLTSACLFFFLIFSVLNGSKSGFMQIAAMFFCFAVVNRKSNPNILLALKKQQYKLMIAGFIIIGIVLAFKSNGIQEIGISFLLRLVGGGDVYWMAYPNSAIERLDGSHPFIVLFQSFLGFFRIIPHAEFPKPLGYTLTTYYYDLTSFTGANARHNIFGYVYFGKYGSILFSFVLGAIIGIVRAFLFGCNKQGTFYKLIMVLLYINVFGLEADPTLYFLYLNNLLVALFVIFILTVILYYGKKDFKYF